MVRAWFDKYHLLATYQSDARSRLTWSCRSQLTKMNCRWRRPAVPINKMYWHVRKIRTMGESNNTNIYIYINIGIFGNFWGISLYNNDALFGLVGDIMTPASLSISHHSMAPTPTWVAKSFFCRFHSGGQSQSRCWGPFVGWAQRLGNCFCL